MAGIEIPILISGANDAISLLGRLSEGLIDAATRMAELAAEQSHLDDMSQRLGLNFDEAAGAAGRFTDEVDVMNTAGAFAARGIHLTQTELNAMTRAAARMAQQTGVETSAALNTLEEALIRGRARGLAPFGAEIAATAAHGYNLTEGLSALVQQESHMESATDDARTSMQGLSDGLGDVLRGTATWATNLLGLPSIIADVSRAVSGLATDIAEVNRLENEERNRQAEGGARARALDEFARAQRQSGEIADRLGSPRSAIAVSNVNSMTTQQITAMVQRIVAVNTRLSASQQSTGESIEAQVMGALRPAPGSRLLIDTRTGGAQAFAQRTEADFRRGGRTITPANDRAELAAVYRGIESTLQTERVALATETRAAAAAERALRDSLTGEGGGGRSAPSEQELRAQGEALRMARVANDNAVLSASVERQTAQAREHLAFTTRELEFAEASRHDHTRRVTSALQAQSQAQAEYNRSLGAEVAAARARVTAEDALIQSQRALRDAAEASLRTGAEQLRQADTRSLSMRRAREDAEAANAAAMGGESAGISTAESARAALMLAETNATRELARATQDLAQARREENDATIPFEERTTRVTEAIVRQTAAKNAADAATASLNAEANKIRTDRTDALTNSTKGLADGLVQAGLAAAFAGESVGAALQKQLAASLQALAVEAAQKALFATATGLFQLATGNPAAGASFASAATFAAVAVTAGAIGAAVAPAAAPSAAAAPGAGRASDVTPSGAGGMGGGGGAGPIVNNYYAPIVGGRQSTDAETGVRIDRYNDAARARLRRAA